MALCWEISVSADFFFLRLGFRWGECEGIAFGGLLWAMLSRVSWSEGGRLGVEDGFGEGLEE